MWRHCLAIALLVNVCETRIGCKNMDGEDVDWLVAVEDFHRRNTRKLTQILVLTGLQPLNILPTLTSEKEEASFILIQHKKDGN